MIDPGFCIRFCILQPRSVRTERHPSASVGWDRSYSFSLGLKGPSWSMVARSVETELSTSCSVGSDRAVLSSLGQQRPSCLFLLRSAETEKPSAAAVVVRGFTAVHREPREHRADREMRHAWLSLRGFPRGPSLAARGPRRHSPGLVWAVLWFACLVLLVLLHCSLVSVVLRARVHVRKKYITGMVYTVFPGWSMTLVYAIIA